MHVSVSFSLGAPQYAQQHQVRDLCDLTDSLFPHWEPHEIVRGHHPALLASVKGREGTLSTSTPCHLPNITHTGPHAQSGILYLAEHVTHHLAPVPHGFPLILNVLPTRSSCVLVVPVLFVQELASKSVRVTFHVKRNVLASAVASLRLHKPQCARIGFLSMGLILFPRNRSTRTWCVLLQRRGPPRRVTVLS